MTKRTTAPPGRSYEQLLGDVETLSEAFASEFNRRSELELVLTDVRYQNSLVLAELKKSQLARLALALEGLRLRKLVVELGGAP